MFSFAYYDAQYRKATTARISLTGAEERFVKQWLLSDAGLLDTVKAEIDAEQIDYQVRQFIIYAVAGMNHQCEIGGPVTPAQQVANTATTLIRLRDREGVLSVYFGRKSERILKCNQE